MDRDTVEVYERGAEVYRDRRRRETPDYVERLAARAGGVRLDLGCGPGLWTGSIGAPVVALDAAHAMLGLVDSTPLRVQADLEALPLRRGAIGATLASKSLQHVPAEHVPMALADLHRAMAVGAPLEVVVFETEAGTWRSDGDDDLPGRMFWDWPRQRLADVLVGAGFTDVEVRAIDRPPVVELRASATRARSLPDVVGPGMRLLVCGLNPSLYAADAGVAYARPGNRFWPAALATGVVTRDRDPWHALRHHGVGFTDLSRRASVAAAELTTGELRDGLARVERLCAWLRPAAVCFLGVTGWRVATGDRRARVGWQERTVGGVPAFVMHNPGGLNAHASVASLAAELEEAVAAKRT